MRFTKIHEALYVVTLEGTDYLVAEEDIFTFAWNLKQQGK